VTSAKQVGQAFSLPEFPARALRSFNINRSITRRALLAALPACLTAQTSRSPRQAKPLPTLGDFVRFVDPTTETFVVRLTNPGSSNWLPAPANRFVSLRERYLAFSSDRGGSLAPFQVDLRTGAVRQLATAANLSPDSLSLDAKERWLYFLDGASLKRIEIAKKELKRPAETVTEDVASFSLSQNGVIFLIRSSGLLERLDNGQTATLAVAAAPAKQSCLAQPRGPGCLFAREVSPSGRELWYASGGPAGGKPVLLAKGGISNPCWSPDGQSVLFLRDVVTPSATLAEIHQAGLDGVGERCVTPTSQFASFSTNFDASVFVGASRSKAQPNVVLLLRSAKREMTLCQHRSTRAAEVSPVFSPDARRVYFQSDEDGKPAIYSVNVELLVEPPGENIEG
jgi:Tol biopolymer transport system component